MMAATRLAVITLARSVYSWAAVMGRTTHGATLTAEPEVVSLRQLYMERGRDVADLLLVVKSRPADIEGDMPAVMAEERDWY